MVNYMNQVNLAGIDEITQNNRTRASAISGTNAQGTMWMQGTGTATSSNSTTGITLTAAQLGGGFIIHNPGTNTVTDTTDTAANILAYMNANSAGVNVGDILQVESFTNASTTNTITIAGGTGVTLDANGTGAVPSTVQKTLNFRCTAIGTSPTFTLYM